MKTFLAPSCEHSSPCQKLLGKHVSRLPIFEREFKKNLERMGSPSYCSGPYVHSCESTRVWSFVQEASWPSRC